MSKKSVIVMPDTQKILENMGEQIKMARLRRNLSTELVAERAGISRATLWAVEKGITSGTAPDTFSPDAECTRAQIVTFLYAAK